MDLALEEENVLVTGGSKGIGLATAELLLLYVFASQLCTSMP
jgi:NAD(P)-dependent dehydrogenase (short-subunit alcohol dehydrogenase family)